MSDRDREFQRLVMGALGALMTAAIDDMPEEMQELAEEWMSQAWAFQREFFGPEKLDS